MSLLPFMPWIIFSILVQYVSLWAASLLSLALLLLINRRNLVGRRLKLLDSAGIAFFLGMVLASLLPGDGSRISHWAAVLGNVTFTGVILASILVGKPFVLQYACERAGPEARSSQRFRQTCLLLSWAWFAAMAVVTAGGVAGRLWPAMPIWLHWGIPMTTFTAAVAFTNWYPAHVRRAVTASS